MVITKPVVIHLDNKANLFEAGNRLALSPDGQLVTEDVEIILDGKRYFLEEGDKIAITEGLYGFPVTPGQNPIDELIKYVQDNWLDWDLTNKTFQSVATKLGLPVPGDLQSWRQLLSSSVQDPGLKQHLLQLTATQLGQPTPELGVDEEEDEEEDGSPSDGSPSDDDDGSPSDAAMQPTTVAAGAATPVTPSPTDSPVDREFGGDPNAPISPTDSPVDGAPGPDPNAPAGPEESPVDQGPWRPPSSVDAPPEDDSPIDQATIDAVRKRPLRPQ